jgi:aspartate/methionine/tyrosine aminotransferase
MSALMLASQALVGPGDRSVIVTPVWPNLVEIPKILGAEAISFPLTFTPDGWTLDLQRLLDTLTPDTRTVCINSPNNPTGWSIGADEQRNPRALSQARHLDHRGRRVRAALFRQ